MSISGRLDDVSVAEVMQFIHLGCRSGTLHLTGESKAEIQFYRGRIVAAQGSRTQRLGELLVTRGVIDQATLLGAVEQLQQGRGGRVLGEVLLSVGAVRREDLTQAVEEHIQETVFEVLTWRKGTFRFALDEVRPIDGFEKTPGELLPGVDLNTQMVLLEAARAQDESRRDRAAMQQETKPAEDEPSGQVAQPKPPEPAVKEGMEDLADLVAAADDAAAAGAAASEGDSSWPALSHHPMAIQVVSRDPAFIEELEQGLGANSIRLETRDLSSAGAAVPGEPQPVVVIDLRAELSMPKLERLHRDRPEAAIVAVIEPGAAREDALRCGAVLAVEPGVDTVIAGLLEVAASHQDVSPLELERRAAGSESIIHRLRRLSEEIRAGALSTNATLVLLNTLSECTERAVVFLVKGQHLSALGGFGFSTLKNNQPVVEATKGLQLSLADQNALGDAVIFREPRRLSVHRDLLPDALLQRIGGPRSGQAAVFPVVGSDRVILLIYADNGLLDRSIDELDLLSLAADQVGVAIENEFLRSRLSGGRQSS